MDNEIATKIEKINNWIVISIRGKFVVKNLTRIRPCFDDAEKNSVKKIVIDLSNVTHIDSSAITLLANFQKRLMEKGAGAIICGASKDILEILSIVGLDKIIPTNCETDYYGKIYRNEL